MKQHYDTLGRQLIGSLLAGYSHLLPRGETTPARFAELIAEQYSLATEQNRVVHGAVQAMRGTFLRDQFGATYRPPAEE